MGDIFIRIRAEIAQALTALTTLAKSFTNFGKSANDAQKQVMGFSQTLQLILSELKTFGNLMVVIGATLKRGGFTEGAQIFHTLGSAIRFVSSVLNGTNSQFSYLTKIFRQLIADSPLLSAAISTLATKLASVGKSTSAFTALRATVSGLITSMAGFAGSVQQLGFVFGILGIQLNKIRKGMESAFRPLLEVGIDLEKSLDQVRAVVPDLNENTQRFTTVTLSNAQAIAELTGVLNSAAGQQQNFSQQVAASAEGLTNFTTDAGQFESLLRNLKSNLAGSGDAANDAVAGLEALARSGANATQAIRALAARGNFQNLRSIILEIAEATQYTASEVSEAAKYLGLAGFSAAEISETLASTVTLAAAGSLDLGRAADIASDNLLAFRLETFSLVRVLDAMAVATSRSNTDIEQLGQALKYAAPFAADLGFTLEETIASIGKLGDVGIKASVAGTSLANAFRALAKQGKNAESVMKELGVTAEDIDPTLNSWVDIIRVFERASANQIIRFFQARGARAVLPLTAQGADELQKFIDLIKSGDFDALSIASTKINNIAGQLLLAKSQLESIFAGVFKTFRDDLSSLITRFSIFLQSVKTFVVLNEDAVRAAAKFAASLFAAVTGLTTFFTLVAGPTTLAGLTGGLLLLAASFLEVTLLAAALTTLFGIGLAAAIGGLIPIIAAIPKTMKDLELAAVSAYENGFKPFVKGFTESFGFGVETIIIPALKELIKTFGVLPSEADSFEEWGSRVGYVLVGLGYLLIKLIEFLDRLMTPPSPEQSGLVKFMEFIYRKTSLITRGPAGEILAEIELAQNRVNTLAETAIEITKEMQEQINTLVEEFSNGVNTINQKAKELGAARNEITRAVELARGAKTNPSKTNEELLGILGTFAEEYGSEDISKVISEAEKRTRAQLEKALEERQKFYDRLAELGQNKTSTTEIFREDQRLGTQIRALEAILASYQGAREAIDEAIKAGQITDTESLMDFLRRKLEFDKNFPVELDKDFEHLRMTVEEILDEVDDLVKERSYEVLKNMGRETEAAILKINQELREKIETIDKELALLDKQILAILNNPDIANKEEADALKEKKDALVDLRNELNKTAEAEIAAEKKKEKEKIEENIKKKEEEREKAVQFLRKQEIEFLKESGKEAAAIQKQYLEDIRAANEEIENMAGLTAQEKEQAKKTAGDLAKASRDKALKDLFDKINKDLEERKKKSEEALDKEQEILKTLLGEVKSARDLVGLFILLSNIQAARVQFAVQSAFAADRLTKRQLKSEQDLARARDKGQKAEAARLEKEVNRLEILAAAQRDVARNAAAGVGLGELADRFNRNNIPEVPALGNLDQRLERLEVKVKAFMQNLNDMLIAQGTAIFDNAANVWADAFVNAWSVASIKILNAVENTVNEINGKFNGIRFPQGLPGAGGGGQPGVNNNNAFAFNVNNNLDLAKLQQGIASGLAAAGFALGAI